MKIIAYIVGAVVVLIVAAAVVLPSVVDLNDYKSVITSRVKAATGRDMVIGGNIDLSILPAPAIAIRDVRLANIDGASVPAMARAAAIEVRVALLPLLRGEIQVETIRLVDPVIELERLADGRANWVMTGATQGGSDGANVRLDDIVIENGTIVYRDRKNGIEERIVGLGIRGGSASLSGPFRLEGRMVARGVPLEFRAALGALGRSAVPVGIELELPTAGGMLTFGGSLKRDSADTVLTGKLRMEGTSLSKFIAALDPARTENGPAMFDYAFSATAAVAGANTGVKLQDLTFELNGVQGTGSVAAEFTDVPKVDVSLNLSRVDLDNLSSTGDTARGRSALSQGESSAAPFALPTGIRASLDIKVNAVVFNQAVVRQVALALALDDGVVTLQQASALLPGGSDIAVFGAIDSANGKPRFNGQVEVSVDNLRAVLDWLAIPAPSVPADRLRKMSFSSNLEITPGLAKISAMDFRVDLTRVSGGINLGLGGHPAFNAIVEIDRLNLDAYLPDPEDGSAAQTDDADDANPFAVLAATNGEIKARLGQLVYRAVPIDGLALDAGLRSGKLEMRSLEFDNALGTRGVISGTIDATGPTFDLRYGIEGEELGRLLRFAGVEATVPPDGFGRFTVHGGVGGNLSEVDFDVAIATPDVEATLVGTESNLDATRTTDVAIELRGKDVADVGRYFGVALPLAPASGDRPFTLKGKITGNAARAEIKAGLSVLGVDARVAGAATEFDGTLGYDVVVDVGHPDLAALAGMFADNEDVAGQTPGAARPALGELSLKARVAGDAVQARLSGIDAVIGPNRLGGDATVRWDGPRPRVEADITADDIVADIFFASAARDDATTVADAPSDSALPGERWSRAPFDLSILRALDASARVAAKSLTFGALTFDGARLRFEVADGVLDIEELSGQLYGAPAEILGQLADAEVPTAEFEILLDGADVGRLLTDLADVEIVSGRVTLAGGFRSEGRSEFDLVSALAGEATIGLHDGVIRGFDLSQLGERLGSLESEQDFLNLVETAFAGGETHIQGLDGSFEISGGVARTDDLRAKLDGGEGRAAGTFDLANWLIDLASEFRLSGYPDTPSFGVDLKGPIDNPTREIQDEELRSYVVAKLAGGALEKAVPAVADDTGTDAAIGDNLQKLTPEPEPQSEPEEVPSNGVLTKVEPTLEPEPQPEPEPAPGPEASGDVVKKIEPAPVPGPKPEFEPEPLGEIVTKAEPETGGEPEAVAGSAIGNLLDTLTGGASTRTPTATEPKKTTTTEPSPESAPSQPFGTLLEGILQGSGN